MKNFDKLFVAKRLRENVYQIAGRLSPEYIVQILRAMKDSGEEWPGQREEAFKS